jgi:hypothetical protein
MPHMHFLGDIGRGIIHDNGVSLCGSSDRHGTAIRGIAGHARHGATQIGGRVAHIDEPRSRHGGWFQYIQNGRLVLKCRDDLCSTVSRRQAQCRGQAQGGVALIIAVFGASGDCNGRVQGRKGRGQRGSFQRRRRRWEVSVIHCFDGLGLFLFLFDSLFLSVLRDQPSIVQVIEHLDNAR